MFSQKGWAQKVAFSDWTKWAKLSSDKNCSLQYKRLSMHHSTLNIRQNDKRARPTTELSGAGGKKPPRSASAQPTSAWATGWAVRQREEAGAAWLFSLPLLFASPIRRNTRQAAIAPCPSLLSSGFIAQFQPPLDAGQTIFKAIQANI